MLIYRFFEPNARRDLDNIAGYAHKVFQDALVKNDILENDGQRQVIGFFDFFGIDKKNPRVEVWIVPMQDTSEIQKEVMQIAEIEDSGQDEKHKGRD